MQEFGCWELQTEICRAASSSCKKCVLLFPFFPMKGMLVNHKRICSKSTVVLLEESCQALIVAYFHRGVSFLCLIEDIKT